MNGCIFIIKIPASTIKHLKQLLYDYPNNEVHTHLFLKQKRDYHTLHLPNKKPWVGTGTSIKLELPSTAKQYFIDCHTHPPKAYKEYNTTIGYPSHSDYQTILECTIKHKQLFHVLVALEGLYIIQLHPDHIKSLINCKNTTKLYDSLSDKYDDYIDLISESKENMKLPVCWGDHEDRICIKDCHDYVKAVNKGSLFFIQFIEYNSKSAFIEIHSPVCNLF